MLTQLPHHARRLEPLVSSAVPDAPDRFTAAYLNNELDDFFDCPPPPQSLAAGAPRERPRRELARLLGAEATRLGAHEATVARAERLAEDGSSAVVAGQQAGLLLGPSFTLSKSAGACRLAEKLAGTPGSPPAVPVFWLASQDHDAGEVNHAFVLDLDEKLHRISLDLPEGVPAGEMPFRREWLDQVLEALDRGRWVPEHADDVRARLHQAAELAVTFADFFAALYYALLGDAAPPVLDPGVPGIAALFEDVLARELDDPLAGPAAINEAGRQLQRLGHAPQLGRGDGATNLFITETAGAELPQRNLLRFDGNVFFTARNRYSKADLLAVLSSEPGRITPAAGLRPVAQDAVLPTTAFFAGPGELRYLAQLRGVYRQHGVPQPVFWPRPHVTVLDPPVQRILSGFGLSAGEYLADPAAHEKRLLLELSGADRLFRDAVAELGEARERMRAALLKFEPTLGPSVDRYVSRSGAALDALADKAAEAAARRERTASLQFGRLRAHLLPGGGKQERVLSPVSHFLKFGVEPVLRLLAGVPETGSVFLEP